MMMMMMNIGVSVHTAGLRIASISDVSNGIGSSPVSEY